jgi:hypothetical protein
MPRKSAAIPTIMGGGRVRHYAPAIMTTLAARPASEQGSSVGGRPVTSGRSSERAMKGGTLHPSACAPCITPADVFRSRAEARALLYAAGELTLHESVDALQVSAVTTGLVDEIGQDAVQGIMTEAFGRLRT